MDPIPFHRASRHAVAPEPRFVPPVWVNGEHITSDQDEATRYRVGELLLALLMGWGIFGQRALLLLATWLGVDTQGLTMPARALTFGLALLVLLSLALRPRLANVGWPLALYMIFWAVYGARLVMEANGPLPETPETERIPLTYIATMAAGACFFPALAALLSTCWSGHAISRWLIILLTMTSGIAMLVMYPQQLTSFEHRMTAGEDMGDVTAMHALTLGYTGAVLIVFALHAVVTQPGLLLRRLVSTTTFGAVGIALLVASASRGPIVSLAVVLLVLICSQVRRGNMSRMFAMLIGIVALGVSIALLTQATGSTLFERLLGTSEDIAAGDGSATRLTLYQQAFDAFAQSPWFGAMSTLDGMAYPHNLIVESLMATGLAGTLPLVGVLIAALLGGWRIIDRRPEVAWLPLLYVLFLAGSMFSWSIYTNVTLWLTMAGTLSCAAWLHASEESA